MNIIRYFFCLIDNIWQAECAPRRERQAIRRNINEQLTKVFNPLKKRTEWQHIISANKVQQKSQSAVTSMVYAAFNVH